MKITQLLLLAMLTAIAGCSSSDGRQRPPPTNVRFFNAAPNYETLNFLRVQRIEAQLGFGAGGSQTFDSGPYDFHIDYRPPGSLEPVRAASFTEDLSPNRNYLFVPVVQGGQLQAMVVSTEVVARSETTSRYTFVHAHPTLQSLDVYTVDTATVTGCDVAGATPQGSVSFGPTPLVFDLSPDTYRICLTAAGDPATVIFRSLDVQLAGTGEDVMLIAYDAGPQTAAQVALSALSTSSSRLFDAGTEAQLRVIHDIDDGLARDVYRNDEITPLFPAPLPVAELSPYVSLSAGPNSIHLQIPGAGDPDATVNFSNVPGAYYTLVFAGDTTNGIVPAVMLEDPRPIVGQATVRIIHAAGMHDQIDAFVLPPGTDISTVNPLASAAGAPGVTERYPFAPGAYEITIRDTNTLAILAGPEAVDLQAQGVYGILVLNDRVDPSRVVLSDIYNPAP